MLFLIVIVLREFDTVFVKNFRDVTPLHLIPFAVGFAGVLCSR